MDNTTIRRFRKNLRHFERELDIQNNSNCCCGVTIAQCHTLLELYENDDILLNELSKKLFLDKSTVSRTIETLVKQGQVTREIPDNNRRSVRIKLTKAGKAVCESIHSGNDNYFSKVLGSIPPEKLNTFLEVFDNVIHTMVELNKNN